MGAEPKEKWYREVRIDDEPLPEPRLNGMTAPPDKLMDKVDRTIRTTVKVSLTVLTWFICIGIGIGGTLAFNHPDYSVIQKELTEEGRAADGEVLSEIGRVCQNESKTPYSCKTLFDSLKDKSKELAQK